MTKSLAGRVALVTGATRGIGKGIAIGLGEAGATVYITGRTLDSTGTLKNAPGTLRETQAAVELAGGLCIPVVVDHGDDKQVQSLFKRIAAEQHGQLDVLVNNAYSGVQPLFEASGQPFWQVDPGLWDACNNVGLRSHYVASVFAARLMSPRRQGLIVTISSWGSLSYMFGVPYGVGKAACDRLAVDMAIELKSYGVTSLSIWPGIVGTEKVRNIVQKVRAMPHAAATVNTPFWQGFNWQTPLLTGRVVAALAADSKIHRRTGEFHIVSELAERYRVVDADGARPVSLRSLRFILPVAVPALRRHTQRVPNLKVPWWLLQLFLNLFKNTKRWEIERAKWNIPQN